MNSPSRAVGQLTRFACALGFALLLIGYVGGAEEQHSTGLSLHARHRVANPNSAGQFRVVTDDLTWDPHQTAVIICDMWDRHWCGSASKRVAEMAPRLDALVSALRDRGVLVIHCPSDTMDYYKDHPGRKLAQAAPKVETKVPLERWCARRGSEPPLPVDDSDGGCPDDPPCKEHRAWHHQIDSIHIKDGDAITDSAEAFYLMKQRGITNVLITGVHENMCVLGRPFSIRQLAQQGMNVLLVRDLTDTMYNPKMPPHVDHFTGTDLVCEHIEKYWCGTITSDQILGGKPFRFAEDKRSQTASRELAPSPGEVAEKK